MIKTMKPRLSKFVLTSHITFSVGWLGAVAVFLALAITGLTTSNNQLARSACLAMGLSTWFVIIPFCLASLFTGVIQALGTKWGLFKHYWIIVKLFLTVAMTIFLLLHIQPISYLAGAATSDSFSNIKESASLLQIISKAGAALLGLIAITTISVYKPWGKTKYKNIQPTNIQKEKKPLSYFLLIGLVSLMVILIAMHLFGGGMKH